MKIEDYNEYYIQGSDYYLIPKDVFMELFNEMINLKEESQKQKEVIDKAKSLNHEISHTIYEDFLEENIIGSKFLYERIKKQLSILEDKEVSK